MKLLNLLVIFSILLLSFNLDAQIQIGNLIIGEEITDRSGSAVSLSSDGKRLAIGAPRNSDIITDAGHVRVYEEINGQWVQIGNDIDGEGYTDQSGYSVSLSSDGRRVAIGAPL